MQNLFKGCSPPKFVCVCLATPLLAPSQHEIKSTLFLLTPPFNSFLPNVLTDDIYAYAVSKTLTKISSPATVGLYSPCQNRLKMILDQIEGMSRLSCVIFCLQIGTNFVLQHCVENMSYKQT